MQRDTSMLFQEAVTCPGQGGFDFIAEHRLLHDGSPCRSSAPRTDGGTVQVDFFLDYRQVAMVEDRISAEGDLSTVRRRWTLLLDGRWILGSRFSAAFEREGELLVPAVMYRNNELGKGAFPTREEAASWSFLESRAPIGGCVHWYGADKSFTVSVEPSLDASLLCSSGFSWERGRAYVELELPGTEVPFAYTGKSERSAPGRDRACLSVGAAELPFVVEQAFSCRCAPTGGASIYGTYRRFVAALGQRNEPSRPRALPSGGRRRGEGSAAPAADWAAYASLKIAHLLSLVEAASGGKTAYLAMGKGNGDLQAIYDYTAGSFLVKSLEGAVILSHIDAGELDDDASAPFKARLARLFGAEDGSGLLPEIAERIGRFFLAGELASGVHQDCYDIRRGVWGGYLGISEDDSFRSRINARCNGEVMKSYVALYEELKRRGREVAEFIDLPKRVAAFYLAHQLGGDREGSFGRWWSAEGEPVNALGTNGAYIASFLMAVEPYFDDKAALSNGLAAAGRYYGSLAEAGEFYGDTLDADSFDKEAGTALLAMFLDFYERDREPLMLGRAREAADFVLTWIWQYDCAFPPDSPLGSRDFRTRGMTSVSVAHHHLDFYGMAIAYDFLRLAEYCGDKLYEEQALRMLSASNQLVASPRDLLGRGAESVGWQPEQINHTAWDYFNRQEKRAGHFDIDIAWVTVLGLGAYQRIKARYPWALAASEEPR